MSRYIFNILALVALVALSGCKVHRTATLDQHIEATTFDSTGVNMEQQLSVLDRLKEDLNIEVDEVIETITTAATDSTPAVTTTRVTRHTFTKAASERETATHQVTHLDSIAVSRDSISSDLHTTESVTVKADPPFRQCLFFCLIGFIVLTVFLRRFKIKNWF